MIKYVVGDATKPEGSGVKVIVHICNDVGAWGRGFVLSLGQRHPLAEQRYRNWFQGNDPADPPFELSFTQYVRVASDVVVANMIAQHGILNRGTVTPIRYDALRRCLIDVEHTSKASGWTGGIHMPRIGCGLAGGEWPEVEGIISDVMSDTDVTVYDFSSNDARNVTWKR